MQKELEKFSKNPAHREVDSCIVSVLSHGVEGGVYGVDGKLLQVLNHVCFFLSVKVQSCEEDEIGDCWLI